MRLRLYWGRRLISVTWSLFFLLLAQVLLVCKVYLITLLFLFYEILVNLLCLFNYLIQVCVCQGLTAPFEYLFEVIFRYVTFVIAVEVMECEAEIGLCEHLLLANGGGEKLGVVDLAVLVQVEAIKHLLDDFIDELLVVIRNVVVQLDRFL